MPPMQQQTRYSRFERRISEGATTQLRRSWRSGSVALLALLLGYFVGQSILIMLMVRVPGGRPLVVLALVLITELMVRLRTRWLGDRERPLGWVMLDNARIGLTFAGVLEAFKLGS